MPPRPFPFPLRVGNDICSIGRIHEIISKVPKSRNSNGSTLDRFLRKLLTWPERKYFYHRFANNTTWPGAEANEGLQKTAQFLAGRWAAKEAIRKACEHLGTSNGFHHIIILPFASSRASPGATFRPQALLLRDRFPEPSQPPCDGPTRPLADFDIESLDGQLCEISISHDSGYATAVALVPVVEDWHLPDTGSEN